MRRLPSVEAVAGPCEIVQSVSLNRNNGRGEMREAQIVGGGPGAGPDFFIFMEVRRYIPQD